MYFGREGALDAGRLICVGLGSVDGDTARKMGGEARKGGVIEQEGKGQTYVACADSMRVLVWTAED
jgi:hypothetical protein